MQQDSTDGKIEKWGIRVGGALVTVLLGIIAWGLQSAVADFKASVKQVAESVQQVAADSKDTSKKVNQIEVHMAEVRRELEITKPADVLRYVRENTLTRKDVESAIQSSEGALILRVRLNHLEEEMKVLEAKVHGLLGKPSP